MLSCHTKSHSHVKDALDVPRCLEASLAALRASKAHQTRSLIPGQAGAELSETERRATEIQAAFEREQRRQQQQQQTGAGPVPGAPLQDGGSSPQRPASSSGQLSPETYGLGGGGVPGASPTREGLRRQSLPGQGQQQQPQQSRSSSRNSSATGGPPPGVGGDPRRRTIRELVAATQVRGFKS